MILCNEISESAKLLFSQKMYNKLLTHITCIIIDTLNVFIYINDFIIQLILYSDVNIYFQ
jgi:hypothetical protein